VKAVHPSVVCNAQAPPRVTVEGGPFAAGLRVELVGPETYAVPIAAIAVGPDALELTLPTADTSPGKALTPGRYAVAVSNPGSASSRLADALTVVAPPSLQEVALVDRFGVELDPVLCAGTPQSLVLRGTGFRDGAAVVIGAQRAPAVLDSAQALHTSFPEGSFGPNDASASGAEVAVRVSNPDGCASPEPVKVKLALPPSIARIHSDIGGGILGDPAVCITEPGVTLIVEGGSFWAIRSGASALPPRASLLRDDGSVFADAAQVSLSPALPWNTSGAATTLTAQFDFPGPPTPLPLTLRVENSNGCVTRATGVVSVDPSPVITAVSSPVSSAIDATVVVDGDLFRADVASGLPPSVSIRRPPAPPIYLGGVSFQGSNRLTATLPKATPPATYDVMVLNPDWCGYVLVNGLVVTP
jgi:hypothetical protein